MIHTLNARQQLAVEALESGKNVFLTGAAGTGKTHVLSYVKNWARQRGMALGVTAATGQAAQLIGGRTLHSFLGIGLGKLDAATLARKTRTKYRALALKLERLQLLILDEVSMVSAQLLETVSDYLKIVRHSEQPFGGVQVLLSGDFCQLPPVEGKFCFLSSAWNALELEWMELTELVRQKDDLPFQQMLQRLRLGNGTDADMHTLEALQHTQFPENIQPTRIYAVNRDVDAINAKQLERLIQQGAAQETYALSSTAGVSCLWAASSNIPATLTLAVGAQVLLTHNISPDDQLVNGSRGCVVALEPNRARVQWVHGGCSWVLMHELEHEEKKGLKLTFMPLRLAWAITVHKAQGMTLDAVEMDLGDTIFEVGQAYTALSRARTLGAVRILRISPDAFRTHTKVLAFMAAARTAAAKRLLQ